MAPALLLWIAREVLLFDPLRVLGWRLSHDERLAQATPSWLRPAPGAELDRDPVALALGGLAVALALAYLVAGLRGAGPRARAVLLAASAVAVVAVPSLALAAMGWVTGRPYGQDGGVVQLPLALERLLAGESPYGADYSASMLGRQARASEFWDRWGGNPILRHHAYLPGTHWVMLPFYALARAWGAGFDTRLVSLLALAASAFLATRLVHGPERRLTAAAVVALNPLAWWHQVFGANDVLALAFLLGAGALAERGRGRLSAASLAFACATKQLAWPFAPFLLAHLAGASSLAGLAAPPARRRLAALLAVFAAVAALVVLPVALLDARAFLTDVVLYNAGLPGADAYPLGGTPGFGAANFLIFFGVVEHLRASFPFALFYLALAPVGLALLRWQMRGRDLGSALAAGGAALLLSVYVSRVVHPNYVTLAAVLLPLAALRSRRVGAGGVALGLVLLALGIETSENTTFEATWADLVEAGGRAALGPLFPRAVAGLSTDPLGLGLAAILAGTGIAVVVVALLAGELRRGVRLAVSAAALAALLAPAAVQVRAAEVTRLLGTPLRAQDAWMASAVADRPAAEAWSRSFRRAPPRRLASPPGPPGARLLARLSDAGRRWDPRWLTAAALALVILAHGANLGLVAVAGVVATGGGLAFGAPQGLALALLLASRRVATGGRAALAGALLGVAGALSPPSLLAAPIAAPLGRGRAWIAGLVATVALAALLSGSWSAGLSTGEPGVGLASLLTYRGWDAGAQPWVTAAWPWILGLAMAGWTAHRSGPSPILSAAGSLAGLFLMPGASPWELALPVGLLALAAGAARDR